MAPNWKYFVDELIKDLQEGKNSWGKNELVEHIKDMMINFLVRYTD